MRRFGAISGLRARLLPMNRLRLVAPINVLDAASRVTMALNGPLCTRPSLSPNSCARLVCFVSDVDSPDELDVVTSLESIGGVFGPRDMADKLRESIAADFQKIAEDPIIAKSKDHRREPL